MHPLATDMIVKQVFQRRDEGDCPSIPAKPAGVLEDVIIDLASRLQAGRSGNYEDRHNGPMVMHPISDINDLDDVCRELGIQDSHVTPAEAVRELNGEIEALRERLKPQQQLADELEAWIFSRRRDAELGLSDIHGPVFDKLLEKAVLTFRGAQP
ncbi:MULTISPECIES: hypothetical protein [unclassified Afipia]|jgi:hypothetical protein|uniref:hypothetical protein n=1 Tax=unclassified Afipia TaxID=2642050 RepID=UPI00046535D2|nr:MULTISPECIES: hypothetical protein [unclassified Afipia]